MERIDREIRENIDSAIDEKARIDREIRENIDLAIDERERIDKEIRENIDQTLVLKNNILEEMRARFNLICDDISQRIRETLDGVKSEILSNADEKIREIKDSCQVRDLAGEIREERINAKQDEIVEKLISTERKLQELKAIQEKNVTETNTASNLMEKRDKTNCYKNNRKEKYKN